MTSDTLNNFEKLLSNLDEKPYIIFSKKNESVEQLLKTSLKDLNDCFIKQQKKGGNKLQELYVNQFDEEQLWSQLKSNDNIVNSKTENWISSMLSNIDEVTLISKGGDLVKEDTQGKKKKKKQNQEEKDWMIEEDNMEAEDIGDDEDAMEEEMGDDYNEEGLDEQDFADEDEDDMRKFEELDQFLENEKININEDEENEEDDDEEEGGFDADMPDEDDEEEQELEGQLRKYRLVEDDEDEDDDEEGVKRPQINDEEVEDDVFTKAREDLFGDDAEEEEQVQKKDKDRRGSEIDKLENRLLEKKTWQTQGEVKAGQRPVNSLLEEALDYNITKKTSTRITAEYSGNLEAMIKQRILDEAWDDPIEYAMGKSIKETFNNLEEINFEKSERGLGQIYEDEYKKNIMGIKSATPDDENKKEIEMLFKKLSYNLDVLSNLSFTPKPNFESTKIVPNVASIRLEEKTPLGFSTRQTNAPEELFDPKKSQLESKEELTTAENRAARRKVKRNIRTRNKEKKKKQLIKTLEFKGQTKHEHNLQQKGIANYAKEVKKKNQKSVEFTKSSQFFDNLQKSQDKKKQPAAAEESNMKRKSYMI